jgi:hypothetical protein
VQLWSDRKLTACRRYLGRFSLPSAFADALKLCSNLGSPLLNLAIILRTTPFVLKTIKTFDRASRMWIAFVVCNYSTVSNQQFTKAKVPHASPMQAWERGGCIAPTHSLPGTRRRWVVSTILQPHYPQQGPSNHCTGGWMGLGVGLDGTKNLTPPGFDPWTAA